MATKDASKLVVVVGMTASGKSAAALKIAQQYGGELICADSRTIYRGMDIGTAKPSAQEQKLVKHHLLDIITPDQKFTAAKFKKLANQAIQDIHSRGKLPIIVGGTGLYINSVIFDYSFGASKTKKSLRPGTLLLGTRLPDDQQRQRINQRIDEMFAQGLELEVKTLSERYGWQAPGLSAIGYREWQDYFVGQTTGDDKITTEDVKQQIQNATWQYARRQRTWFRANPGINWQDA